MGIRFGICSIPDSLYLRFNDQMFINDMCVLHCKFHFVTFVCNA